MTSFSAFSADDASLSSLLGEMGVSASECAEALSAERMSVRTGLENLSKTLSLREHCCRGELLSIARITFFRQFRLRAAARALLTLRRMGGTSAGRTALRQLSALKEGISWSAFVRTQALCHRAG